MMLHFGPSVIYRARICAANSPQPNIAAFDTPRPAAQSAVAAPKPISRGHRPHINTVILDSAYQVLTPAVFKAILLTNTARSTEYVH